MNFITPAPEELSYLRADPLLWEQELDVRPDVAEDIERATGIRAGRVYWRSAHDYLYSLELADLGRGRPSMAMVLGYWDRYEPRPPEHEITADLADFSIWLAGIAGSLNPADVIQTFRFAGVQAVHTQWPKGSVLRTPEERFANLPDFPYEPKYVEIEGLRMAYVEEGAGAPILLLHGEPTWGYLYRRMIPALAKVGRVIVPDLIGFGRSDKPVPTNAYSYKSHVRWLRGFVESLSLFGATMVCHDWGGLLGLRVLADAPLPFARVVAMNTGLPAGRPGGRAFMEWRRFSQRADYLDAPQVVRGMLRKRALTDAEAAGYSAPFPSKEYQTAARVFPRLVPIRPEDPGAYDNRVAIEKLTGPTNPSLRALLIWSGDDPITARAERHVRSLFKNVAPPVTIPGAGHFIQEDAGEEVAGHIVRWLGEQTAVGVVLP
jgi:haloalkane dehalogenase